jgi:glycosyltransferase involved in cell wall biosynthesis
MSVNGELSCVATGDPIVSLVMCTLGDRKKQLARLLRSLAEQEFNVFELIVVDQNPAEYLDDVLMNFGAGLRLKHVRSARGLSLARNVGLGYASGRIIGFPDDDCWYLSDTVQQVVAFFDSNPGTGILLGRTVDEFGSPSLSPFRQESGPVNRKNIWISGNSNTLFVRRTAIPKGARFDENIGVGAHSRFQSGEETDFILGLLGAGASAVYMSDLKVCHDQVERGALALSLKRSWIYSQGFGYVLRKHDFGIVYVLYRAIRSFGSAVFSVLRFNIGYGLARIVWGVGTLVGFATAAAKAPDWTKGHAAIPTRDVKPSAS